mmetsp:Transcript_47436/g.92574  ORF Transcript_47436/g.92574 Transcript_47436/m.92574 type:complete len:380 (+) Transcript_47436:56-1195(+)|eukprot:CAMPEP_0194325128 /NCGR_PEP_ID=MMETSP0171-20130528/29058_1 /TAXON_ID=218684 /ORGANISM="Corethron pennatum, Strain L29A3" /LENGTH=379 /DNA_ID=CAMNT_0039084161 /DNA_START=48 /DNA_END=1187 /DNA_ORIENTATION=-
METKIEDSNLANIGSDEDKAAREAAASLENCWEGAGESLGIQIWRVENNRKESEEHGDTPVFGIADWPKKKYGQFYRGDSYILLETRDVDGDGAMEWDIHFWIGKESTQDEYGVAAYKANELDDLLGDTPIQYRECEGQESEEFMELFPKGIRYLEGGTDSGFRDIDADTNVLAESNKLFMVKKKGKSARAYTVPCSCSSLNTGDAFLLDAFSKIYTWYGEECSPFEKSKAGTLAHNIANERFGHCETEVDVEDDNEEFWALLGGKGEIAPANAVADVPDEKTSTTMEVLDFDVDTGNINVRDVDVSRGSLDTGAVYIVDTGRKVYVWIGKKASDREKTQAMLLVNRRLKSMEREKTTAVTRIIEGQERRCKGFLKAFK